MSDSWQFDTAALIKEGRAAPRRGHQSAGGHRPPGSAGLQQSGQPPAHCEDGHAYITDCDGDDLRPSDLARDEPWLPGWCGAGTPPHTVSVSSTYAPSPSPAPACSSACSSATPGPHGSFLHSLSSSPFPGPVGSARAAAAVAAGRPATAGAVVTRPDDADRALPIQARPATSGSRAPYTRPTSGRTYTLASRKEVPNSRQRNPSAQFAAADLELYCGQPAHDRRLSGCEVVSHVDSESYALDSYVKDDYDDYEVALSQMDMPQFSQPGSFIHTFLADLSMLRALWRPERWLEAREEVKRLGSLQLLLPLLRSVRFFTDQAVAARRYELPPPMEWPADAPDATAGDPYNVVVDLRTLTTVAPKVDWLCQAHQRRAAISPSTDTRELVFDCNSDCPLDVAIQLQRQGVVSSKAPLVVLVEVNAFDYAGRIDISNTTAFSPPDVLLRTNLASYLKHAQDYTHTESGTSVRSHLTAMLDPYLFRCENALILRGSHEEGYPFLEKPVIVHLMVMAMPTHRPEEYQVAMLRGGMSEWYGTDQDHLALLARLEIIGEMATSGLIEPLDDEDEDEDEDWGDDVRANLVMAVPGCSGVNRQPTAAVGNALKHWRRHYGTRFKAVHVSCRGRAMGDASLQSRMEKLANFEMLASRRALAGKPVDQGLYSPLFRDCALKDSNKMKKWVAEPASEYGSDEDDRKTVGDKKDNEGNEGAVEAVLAFKSTLNVSRKQRQTMFMYNRVAPEERRPGSATKKESSPSHAAAAQVPQPTATASATARVRKKVKQSNEADSILTGEADKRLMDKADSRRMTKDFEKAFNQKILRHESSVLSQVSSIKGDVHLEAGFKDLPDSRAIRGQSQKEKREHLANQQTRRGIRDKLRSRGKATAQREESHRLATPRPTTPGAQAHNNRDDELLKETEDLALKYVQMSNKKRLEIIMNEKRTSILGDRKHLSLYGSHV